MRKRSALAPVLVSFLFVNALTLVFHKRLAAAGFDTDVLLLGNVFLLLVIGTSYFIARRGVTHQSTHRFLQSVYSSILLKLFVIAIAAFVYIAISKQALNKPALFTLMGLYLLYSFFEVRALTALLRKNTNA